MASPRQSLSLSNIIIDIPPQFIEKGQTLFIEKHSNLFIDGCHLSKPSKFIREIHGLCLIDTQQQDLRSVTSNHELESDIEDNELIQIIIEFFPDILHFGKNLIIEGVNSNEEFKSINHFQDLYNNNNCENVKNIYINIPKEHIQRGKTIHIKKSKILVMNTNDYHKDQIHHLSNNKFTKRDYLQSENIMEIAIELPPEFFNNGQIITIRKEDPQSVEANFPYHRKSKPDI